MIENFKTQIKQLAKKNPIIVIRVPKPLAEHEEFPFYDNWKNGNFEASDCTITFSKKEIIIRPYKAKKKDVEVSK